MRRMHLGKRIISLMLCMVLLVTPLSACGKKNTPTPEDAISSVDVDAIVDRIISDLEVTHQPSQEDITDVGFAVNLAYEVEDYVGDLETFVYGLIVNELGYGYDVFPAYVELSDGSEIYGIGYSDYSECYEDESGNDVTFLAGFIPYYGEYTIPNEDFDAGLTVYDMEYESEEFSFILAYQSDSYTNHCVIYGQYLHYGIGENGQVTYWSKNYVKGTCDEDLGSLYSYDESRYVFENNVGGYVTISGTSLYSQIDYDELEKEINAILETQDTNFVSYDIESAACFAQEAIEAYLLSMQEETFLGYDVATLIEESKKLDPLECYRITSDGLVTLDIEEYQSKEETLVKWLVGTACVIVAAVGIVASMVCIACPILSSVAGALTGTAIEIFMQVIIAGEDLSDINWGKVALAAAAGAVSGFLGPYITATTSGVANFLLDSSLDGLIGGIETAVGTWMEGGDGLSIAKSMGIGFAIAFGLSAGFKGAGVIIGKLANKLGPSIAAGAYKLAPKLTKNVSKFAKGLGKGLTKLKSVADSTPFHSKYISNKIAFKQLARLQSEGSDRLKTKSLNHLKATGILDKDNNPITKETLEKIFKKASDGSVIGYFDMGDELVEIVKKNGIVGVVFDNSKYQTVFLEAGLVADRSTNFKEAVIELKKSWLKDSTQIPESIAEAIKATNMDLEDIGVDALVKIIKKSDMVLHENVDMQTITLVSRALHEEIKHMGGYALAKDLKYHMGKEYFERFISAAANGAVIAGAD